MASPQVLLSKLLLPTQTALRATLKLHAGKLSLSLLLFPDGQPGPVSFTGTGGIFTPSCSSKTQKHSTVDCEHFQVFKGLFLTKSH